MPAVEIYSVDFKNGNLNPAVGQPWGNMKQGFTNAADHPESYGDSKGLNLSVYRAANSVAEATNSVYVLPGPGAVPVESRIVIRVEFDRPWAQPTYVPLSPNNSQPQGPNTTTAGSPWAIGLGVKFGNENDTAADKKIPVTCQFNRTLNGIRLNTPGSLQGNPASTILEGPLDYSNFWPANPANLFVLEHSYCGIRAPAAVAGSLGYAVGSGALRIGARNDHRVYSNRDFSSPGAPTSIQALGVSLVTVTGVGQITVRLRSFSVSIWQ